jgi:hypothetical protein
MAKDLPYFKFYCSEWSDGDISLEDMNIQGLFINVCAYYWSNEGVLTLSKCKKKFKLVPESDFKVLIESNIIKVDSNDNIVINFLNEQLQERDRQSVINKINGSKGGRPSQNKPKDNQTETEEKPNGFVSLTEPITETEPKQKAIIEEEKREEEKREENIHPLRLFVSDNFPNVSKMKTQLTNENCIELIERFKKPLIHEKLLAMENTAQLTKKNLSVYLTLINWCSKEIKTTPLLQTDKPVHTPNPKKRII